VEGNPFARPFCFNTDNVRIEIKESAKFDNVELFIVDLASFASVSAFCEKVEREVPRLDILVENAALVQNEFIPTSDGWEHQ
jgi:retinol dehydrogenase-12